MAVGQRSIPVDSSVVDGEDIALFCVEEGDWQGCVDCFAFPEASSLNGQALCILCPFRFGIRFSCTESWKPSIRSAGINTFRAKQQRAPRRSPLSRYFLILAPYFYGPASALDTKPRMGHAVAYRDSSCVRSNWEGWNIKTPAIVEHPWLMVRRRNPLGRRNPVDQAAGRQVRYRRWHVVATGRCRQLQRVSRAACLVSPSDAAAWPLGGA